MIIGFEIPIQELRTVFKLSQDRDKESYQNIIEKLNEQGGDGAEIAAQISKIKSELFKSAIE